MHIYLSYPDCVYSLTSPFSLALSHLPEFTGRTVAEGGAWRYAEAQAKGEMKSSGRAEGISGISHFEILCISLDSNDICGCFVLS